MIPYTWWIIPVFAICTCARNHFLIQQQGEAYEMDSEKFFYGAAFSHPDDRNLLTAVSDDQ